MPNYTRLSETTHKLDLGVVSYSLIRDILCYLETFLYRMKYIVDTVPDEDYSTSHAFIEELIKAADQEHDLYFEKAKAEIEALGGNDV